MRMKKRRRNAVMVPVASMGDIAFLLIIFFMLCSNFAKEAGLQIKPARAFDLDALQESNISVSIDETGDIYLQGILMEDVEVVEWGIKALLEGRTEDLEKVVMFKCDREIDKSIYEPVLSAISEAGGIIAAIGEEAGTRDN